MKRITIIAIFAIVVSCGSITAYVGIINSLIFTSDEDQQNTYDENLEDVGKFYGSWFNESEFEGDTQEVTYNFSSDDVFTVNIIYWEDGLFETMNDYWAGYYYLADNKLIMEYTSPFDMIGERQQYNYSFSNDNTTLTLIPVDNPQYVAVYTKIQDESTTGYTDDDNTGQFSGNIESRDRSNVLSSGISGIK